MTSQLKLLFNATAIKVRAELSSADAHLQPLPPLDLLERARAKMDMLQKSQQIEFSVSYAERLGIVWQELRSSAVPRSVTVTLAAGIPRMPGIAVSPSKSGLFNITVDKSKADPKLWRYEWFKLQVLRLAGPLKENPVNAHIFSAYCRARLGLPVTSLSVAPISSVAAGTKPFSVVGRRAELEVTVVIRNLADMKNKANRDAMLVLVRKAAQQMTTPAINFMILEKDLLTGIEQALQGPEQFGIGMPLVMLAALGRPAQSTQSYPGAGRIAFAISDDRMVARIVNFDMNYYWDQKAPVTMEWLEAEMQHCGLKRKPNEDLAKALADAMKGQVNLNGLIVCQGRVGSPASEPYLHPVFKDAQGRIAADLDHAQVNIRDLQQRDLVKSGQLVAEIRYKTPGTKGKDVYGVDLPAPLNEAEQLIVRVGEGIQKQGHHLFYATFDGIPVLNDNDISLTKIFIHNGDVNLKTGNIYYDGPIEIRGSVEQGAVVEGTEDIVVKGSVLNARIVAKGNLIVEGGITANAAGKIVVRGDLAADFIEGATIECAGRIFVEKAILNANIFCQGIVKVKSDDGIIGGGNIMAEGSVLSANIGFKHGAITSVCAGMDWKRGRTRFIKSKRLKRLEEVLAHDRLVLRELLQKKSSQVTAKHQALKEAAQDRLVRVSVLVRTLKQILANLPQQYNKEAKIYVPKILQTHCQLEIAGQIVPVTTELAHVTAAGKKKRDSYFTDIDELSEDDKKIFAAIVTANYK